MTREEFKTAIHTISDLMIDIAELNTPGDNHPLTSILLSVSGSSDVASVCIKYPEKEIKSYPISPCGWMDCSDPQEVIRELKEIKARLEKERKPHETDNKES